MTNGEAIKMILDHGPITRDALCAAVAGVFAIPPVETWTIVIGMRERGEVLVEDDVVRLVEKPRTP